VTALVIFEDVRDAPPQLHGYFRCHGVDIGYASNPVCSEDFTHIKPLLHRKAPDAERIAKSKRVKE
jgi:hypothetical protein